MVFENLPDAKILELANVLDESIIRKPDLTKITGVVGEHLSEPDVVSVINVFYNFFINRASYQQMIRLIDATRLQEQKKDVLKQVLKNIHEKSDAQKVTQMKTIAELDVAGHPHFHQLRIYTEFRPVSDNGKITKLVPKLVVSGLVHEPNVHDDRTVLIQMDLEDGRKLAKEFSNQLEAFEAEIKFMKEKLGPDIID